MIDDFRAVPDRSKSLAKIQTLSKAAINQVTFDSHNQMVASNAVAAAYPTNEPVAAAEIAYSPHSFDLPNSTAEVVPKKKLATKLAALKHWRPRWHWPPTKKELLIGVAVVLLLAGGVSAFLLTRPIKPLPAAKPVAKVVPVVAPPTTVASALTGLQVDPTVNNRPVTGVMVENSPDARPQSGIGQAGVVFEAIAEGGITRFLTLFQDTTPEDIGPVRSVRPYFLKWAMTFDAPLAHVGGSPEALQNIKSWGAKDLDQSFNSGSFRRITARYAPHNVYTGITALNQLETSKGYGASKFTSWLRKADKPSKLPTAKTVDLAISSAFYNAHYDYNAPTNSYNRSEGGAPHLDAATNTQISTKVVIALVMSYGIQADGKHSEYGTVGSGQAYVFQDGDVTIGSWSKADNTSQFVFTDAAGKPLALNAGNTWLTAIANAPKITYAP